MFHPHPVLFNYGSFDPFAAVDLGLISQKRGRSPAMLRRERSILDQVQVWSILRLILPEMVAQNQIKLDLRQEKMYPLWLVNITSPPKSPTATIFHALLTQTITITTSSDSKAPSTLQIALYKPLAVDLKYSVTPIWIIQSHLFGLSGSKITSISIHGYVDLRRFLILYGKTSSIDLSSIDSNGIRSPCT